MKKIEKILSGINLKVDNQKIKKITEYYRSLNINFSENKDFLKQACALIDLTTLEGNDTQEKIILLCRKANKPLKDFPHCAAICVYPVFLKTAYKELKNKGVKLASVATAFPSGQQPLDIKLREVEYCIKNRADEIDMVISRGEFLSGNLDFVFNEIKKVKELCLHFGKKPVHLKVILETGELRNLSEVKKASMLAMYAGGDFIKTSTGKISVSATPESVIVMCLAIKEFYAQTGKKIGIKAAGGIRTAEDAYLYYNIVNDILGKEWLSAELLRFGASSLLNDLIEKYK